MLRRASSPYTSTDADWFSIPPTNSRNSSFESVCMNRIRKTSSATAPVSRPKRSLAA